MRRSSLLLFVVLFLVSCQTGPKLSPEELQAKWRVPLGLSALNAGICTGLQQTAQQLQAEETDGFSAYGALMGAAMMIRVVEESLAQAEPAADQAKLQAQMEADVAALRATVSSWVNKETTSADVLPVLDKTCPDITATFEQVAKAATDDGLTPEAMTQIMEDMRQAMAASVEKDQ